MSVKTNQAESHEKANNWNGGNEHFEKKLKPIEN